MTAILITLIHSFRLIKGGAFHFVCCRCQRSTVWLTVDWNQMLWLETSKSLTSSFCIHPDLTSRLKPLFST